MEIMKVNSRLPDFLRRRHVGRDRRGARRRAAARSSSSRSTASRPSSTALDHFMDYGEQVALRALAGAAEGHVRTRRGAGQRRGLQGHGRDHRRRVRRRPARQPRPGPRARTTPAATASMVAAQMVFKNLTEPHSAGQRRPLPAAEGADAPRLGLRREAAGRVRASTTRSRSGSTT